MATWTDIQMHQCANGHAGIEPNILGNLRTLHMSVQQDKMYLCLYLIVSDLHLFKANFLLKELEKFFREPPDCTGNEPKPDIPT